MVLVPNVVAMADPIPGYKPRKKGNVLRGAHGQSRWFQSGVKDKVSWNWAPIWGGRGEGICETLRIPRVDGVETRSIRSREESTRLSRSLSDIRVVLAVPL